MCCRLFLLVIIFCVCNLYASKIKLNDGTVYSGSIISDNDNFLTVSVNGSQIRILKSLIADIDGKKNIIRQPESQSNTTSQPPSKSLLSDKKTEQSASNSNLLKVVLKNGTIFEGTIISENERLLVLNVNNSPVNIYKNIIAEIKGNQVAALKSAEPDLNKSPEIKNEIVKDSLPKKETNRSVAQRVKFSSLDDEVNTNTAKLKNEINSSPLAVIDESKQTPKVDNAGVGDSSINKNGNRMKIAPVQESQTVPSQINESEKSIAANSTQKIEKTTNDTIQKAKTDNKEIKQDALSTVNKDNNPENNVNKKKLALVETDNDQSSEIKPSPNVSRVNKSADSTATAAKKTIPVSSTAKNEKTTANVKAIPDSVPTDIIRKKTAQRADGKIEIILKNGTSFIGKIVSEDERLIQLESDGAIINILKNLIQNVNGESFVNNQKQVAAALVPQKRDDNVQLHTDSTVQKMQIEKELLRTIPKVKIPEGMAIKQVIDSLHSPNWEKRSQAARMLTAVGQWGTEAIPALKAQVKDTIKNNLYEPVWIDSSNASKLLSPGDEAARALAAMGQAGFETLKQLSNDENDFVRRRAAFGIGDIMTDQAGAVLQSLLKDPDSRVRAVAITGLRSSKYRDLLISMLKDDDGDVKCNTAFMLGKLKDPRACQYLKTLLYDRRTMVRAQAAASLRIIGGTEAVSYLIEALKDGNLNVRENAVYALGECKDSSTVLHLLALSKDKSKDVRIAILIALSQIRDSRAIPTIYALLKDNDNTVREQAAVALKKHTEIPSLIDALDDASTTVKENAIYMLWLLSGQDIGQDKKLWTEWYNKSPYASRNSKVKM